MQYKPVVFHYYGATFYQRTSWKSLFYISAYPNHQVKKSTFTFWFAYVFLLFNLALKNTINK